MTTETKTGWAYEPSEETSAVGILVHRNEKGRLTGIPGDDNVTAIIWMPQAAAEPLAAYLNALEACAEALRWALSCLDRGDGVLEYTGPIEDGDNALAALARLDALRP